jgi:hypothetical protein
MNELQTLAEQIRTLDGFRWLPGMADADGDRVVAVDRDGIFVDGVADRLERGHMSAPGLTDPLTVEALVVLMRERDASVHMACDASGKLWWCEPFAQEIESAADYALAVARAAVEVLR